MNPMKNVLEVLGIRIIVEFSPSETLKTCFFIRKKKI
jgi:hypothetical protein